MRRISIMLLSALRAAASRPATVVFVASTSMLTGALAFEHIGGMAPCHLCMDQRYAHACAASFALAAMIFRRKDRMVTTIAAAAVLLLGSAIAIYHVGVERHLWGGSCSMNFGDALTAESLRTVLLGVASAPCDLVAWSMFGISMAGWNALISIFVGLWAIVAVFPTSSRDRATA